MIGIQNANINNANLVFFNPVVPTPKSVRFFNELLDRVKDHTHELSDDNPIKPLAKKYIWAERLMSCYQRIKISRKNPAVKLGLALLSSYVFFSLYVNLAACFSDEEIPRLLKPLKFIC